jgi:hypothetical protein
MEPQTTKVPAETKPMNKYIPLIHQGTAPPAAKKERISLPDFFEKDSPIKIISKENDAITMKSVLVICSLKFSQV